MALYSCHLSTFNRI